MPRNPLSRNQVPGDRPSRNHKVLAAIFGLSGVVHFVAPQAYESIVPGWLPAHRTLIYASGAAELACCAGLLDRQRWARPLSVATLLAVWPANIQMAVDAGRSEQGRRRKIATWARVPMQLPMIRMALAKS